MSQPFKHIMLWTMTALMMPVIAAGCSDANAPSGPDTDNAKVYLTLDMSLRDGEGTRSHTIDDNDTSNDGTEPGTDKENAIHRMIVVLKDGDDMLSFPVASPGALTAEGDGYTASLSLPFSDFSRFAGKNVKLYILANHNAAMLSAISGGSFDPASDKYVLTGADDALLNADKGLPMSNCSEYSLTIPTDLSPYITKNSPLDLTEKGVVELERSVARIDYQDASVGHNHTFPIVNNDESHTPTGYRLTLASMHLFNVSDRFFAFRHEQILPDGFLTGDIAIKATDLDAHEKSVTSGYSIWRYISENKIPDDSQIQKNTTGIRFHFRITGTPNGTPTGTDPITLQVNGEKKIVEYSADDADGAGYYVDYYYFIRHNDNGDPQLPGPMEFSVVRNNIYRLSIESISGIPVPYNPEDPDEYPGFKVNVRIAKWKYHKYVFDM